MISACERIGGLLEECIMDAELAKTLLKQGSIIVTGLFVFLVFMTWQAFR